MRSSKILSIIVWKVVRLFVRPKNIMRVFIQAMVDLEGSCSLIILLYLDIVETPLDIQFHEVLGSTELCN